ncbi:MAG TPA: helix-turn-helix transcriptional regulator [Chthoniobacterales bacterium]
MIERPLLPAVEKLLEWRQRNGLRQAQVHRAMHRHGFPVALSTLQKWETGERKPTRISALAPAKFLEKHPVVSVVSRPSPTDADE